MKVFWGENAVNCRVFRGLYFMSPNPGENLHQVIKTSWHINHIKVTYKNVSIASK